MYQKELKIAKLLASQAGDIMLKYFDTGQNKELKKDGSPVTVADKEINRMVIEELTKYFPEDGIVGEEESTAEYGMGRKWICDPLDGTLSFTWGLPTSMFSLALAVDGKPVMGVAYDPYLKRMYWGIKNSGSFLNEIKLKVSDEDVTSGVVGMPFFMERIFNRESDIVKLRGYKCQLAVFDGAVLRGCLVARGSLVGYPHPLVKPHDIAAVQVILEEAGGKVTDIHGRPLDYSRPFVGAVLSNGKAHEQLLDLFR